MWTYEQSTGRLSHDGTIVGTGYSGAGDGKNNPSMQNVVGVGPIPCGLYVIGEPFNSTDHGPFAMHLYPDAENEMFGREGFLMHGDSIQHPGNASEGCIIMPREVRTQVWDSGDRALTVISGNMVVTDPEIGM